jgi:hypothetical protein
MCVNLTIRSIDVYAHSSSAAVAHSHHQKPWTFNKMIVEKIPLMKLWPDTVLALTALMGKYDCVD